MNFRNRDISPQSNLLNALKRMDQIDKKLLIVVDNNKFVGLISIGDIQRAIIQNVSLETSIAAVLRKNLRIAKPDDNVEHIKKMIMNYRMEFCPVVNSQNEILEIYYWEDLFQYQPLLPVSKFRLPVVIMAGGLGERLKPLTNVLPKALIPIGDKSMLEEIFDRFGRHGCNEFYISVNYKSELIEYYLNSQKLPYQLNFLKEEMQMGTAGSLSLLKGRINQTFFVSNCDILIEQDYSEILDYHRENQNDLTIVAALKHYPIPYGIVETGINGALVKLREKPELTFKINSGMYILEPHLIDQIPDNLFFHITELISAMMQRKSRIGVFPVSEKSWRDVGSWKEYAKHL